MPVESAWSEMRAAFASAERKSTPLKFSVHLTLSTGSTPLGLGRPQATWAGPKHPKVTRQAQAGGQRRTKDAKELTLLARTSAAGGQKGYVPQERKVSYFNMGRGEKMIYFIRWAGRREILREPYSPEPAQQADKWASKGRKDPYTRSSAKGRLTEES